MKNTQADHGLSRSRCPLAFAAVLVAPVVVARADICPSDFLGSALVCDGIDDYAVVPNAVGLPTGNAPYSVELWVKMTERRSYPSGGHVYNGFIFSRGSEGTHQLSTIVGLDGHIGLTHWGSDNDTGVPFPLNTWVHIAVTYDGGTERLYVNGSPVWSTVIPGGLNVQGGSVTLGKHDNFNDYHFAGLIDEVRVWRVVRTDAEIAAEYQHVVAPDAPGLAGYWRFDEPSGPTAFDLAAGNHATLMNGATRAAFTCCAVDFNDDGFVDFFDYDDYIACFEGGPCPPGKSADFSGDGFADFFDYDEFVGAFERGC